MLFKHVVPNNVRYFWNKFYEHLQVDFSLNNLWIRTWSAWIPKSFLLYVLYAGVQCTCRGVFRGASLSTKQTCKSSSTANRINLFCLSLTVWNAAPHFILNFIFHIEYDIFNIRPRQIIHVNQNQPKQQ